MISLPNSAMPQILQPKLLYKIAEKIDLLNTKIKILRNAIFRTKIYIFGFEDQFLWLFGHTLTIP